MNSESWMGKYNCSYYADKTDGHYISLSMAYANLKKLLSETMKLLITGPKKWIIYYSGIQFLNTISAN